MPNMLYMDRCHAFSVTCILIFVILFADILLSNIIIYLKCLSSATGQTYLFLQIILIMYIHILITFVNSLSSATGQLIIIIKNFDSY